MERRDISGLDLSADDLSGNDLSGANLRGIDLSNKNLTGVDLTNADLTRAKFNNSNLTNVELMCSRITGVDFSGANLTNVDLSHCIWDERDVLTIKPITTGAYIILSNEDKYLIERCGRPRPLIDEYRLPDNFSINDAINKGPCGFFYSMLEPIHTTTPEQNFKCRNFSERNLTRHDFSNSNLTGADFSGADLTGANLSHAILRRAYLGGANLTGANLSGTDLTGAIFQGAIFDYDDYDDANLENANLTGANLTAANLEGANLKKANLLSANLSYANLDNAKLSGAILCNANLENTNLRYTDLRAANLSYAYMDNVDCSNDLYQDVFRGFNLTGASLYDVNFNGLDLSNTNLSRTKMNIVSLYDANLTDTNLSKVYKYTYKEFDKGNSLSYISEAAIIEATRSHTPLGFVEKTRVIPQGIRGIAYEVHNSYDKFLRVKYKYLSIIDQPDSPDYSTKDKLFVFIYNIFEPTIRRIFPEDPRKLQELDTVFGKLVRRDTTVTSDELELIGKSVNFAFSQDDDNFKEQYIITLLDESCRAYAGSGDTTSCVKGIKERFVLAVGNVVEIICKTGCENKTYKKLDKLLNSKFDIIEETSEWFRTIPTNDKLQQFIKDTMIKKCITDLIVKSSLSDGFNKENNQKIQNYVTNDVGSEIFGDHLELSGGGKKSKKSSKKKSSKKKSKRYTYKK
jgi:uncharacterized protein YjbI with pentapeptide repeats